MRRPILVIQSDPQLRAHLEAVLDQAGFEVSSAADGLEGLETLYRHAPCWVLLGASMPRMDGFEFLSALGRVPFPPRVFMVADISQQLQARAARLGAPHVFPVRLALRTDFGIALRRALGLPEVDPVLPEQVAA